MTGRIVSDVGHLCGLMPTAVKAYAVWECDICGQRWVYQPPQGGYVSWSGCWIPGLGWRWEKSAPEVAATVQRRRRLGRWRVFGGGRREP